MSSTNSKPLNHTNIMPPNTPGRGPTRDELAVLAHEAVGRGDMAEASRLMEQRVALPIEAHSTLSYATNFRGEYSPTTFRPFLSVNLEDTESDDDVFDELAAEVDEPEITQIHNHTICGGCSASFTQANEHDYWFIEDRLFCKGCFEQHFIVCFKCKDITNRFGNSRIATSYDIMQEVKVCRDCLTELVKEHEVSSCRGCSNFYMRGSSDKFMADRCYLCILKMKSNSEIIYRKYDSYVGLECREKGKYITSLRKFGIELEAIQKGQAKASKASFELPSFMGVAQDNSIKVNGDSGYGVEFQTPPANGLIAEELIENAQTILVKNGFYVNETCGYHIHVDVSRIDKFNPNDQLNSIKRLWLTYLCMEDVLLSFLPPSRRTNIRYCAPIRSEYNADEIIRAQNIDKLEELWYRTSDKYDISRAKAEHRHPSRYRGINFHSLFAGRHFEIRYHTGTLNTVKILEWANLQLKIADWAISQENKMSWDDFKEMINDIDIAEKTSLLFDMCDLSPSARDYFLARQESFKKVSKPRDTLAFKSSMKLLEDEKEK